jgi:hypothetical protein
MGKDEAGANPDYALLKRYIWTRMRRKQTEKKKGGQKCPPLELFSEL